MRLTAVYNDVGLHHHHHHHHPHPHSSAVVQWLRRDCGNRAARLRLDLLEKRAIQ